MIQQFIGVSMKFALDSTRRLDTNGFLHVGYSNISKECVSPYYGYEIPNHKEHGLEEKKVYYGYRSGVELEQCVESFNGLPLLRGHYVEHAESPQKEHRVGSLGTDCRFVQPYLQNSLIVTDAEAIRKIQSGERVELSAAYAYEPLFETGTFEGQNYDFVMTKIKGNHVALVEEGRAGPDVVVADSALLENASHLEKTQNTNDKINDSENVEFKNILALLEELFQELSKIKEKNLLDMNEKTEQKEAVGDFIEEKDIIVNQIFREEENEEKVHNETLDRVESDEENYEGSQYEECDEYKKELAQDVSIIKIKSEITQEFKQMHEALSLCIPFTGEMDMFAFDNASDIYMHACNLLKIPTEKESAQAVIKALSDYSIIYNQKPSFSDSQVFKSRFE